MTSMTLDPATHSQIQQYTQTAPLVLCDDDPLGVRILSLIMKRAGLNAVSLPNPYDVIALARTQTVSLVITDMWKDGSSLNGLDLLRHLRRETTLFTLPVMMLSADNSREVTQRAYQQGANAYVFKPYDVPRLLEVTRNLIRQGMGR
jgi:DNA-binding response OmpR family regulator